MRTASDIMNRNPITVPPEMTIEELGRLFIDKSITGAAVVDKSGALAGVVTENDLISKNKRLHIPTVLRLFDAFIPLEGFGALETEIKKITATVVDEICTKDPVTVGESAGIEEIATIMAEENIHHIPVIKDGRLAGMIDRHDLIKGIAGESD